MSHTKDEDLFQMGERVFNAIVDKKLEPIYASLVKIDAAITRLETSDQQKRAIASATNAIPSAALPKRTGRPLPKRPPPKLSGPAKKIATKAVISSSSDDEY